MKTTRFARAANWAFPCSFAASLWLPASIASAGVGFPADRLHIVAAIDGSDELHLSYRNATWVHKSGTQATDVRINGVQWNPQQKAGLTTGANGWLLPPGQELCGAVLHKLSGRGSVDLGWDAAGLVLRFDDPEAGAGLYEAEVSFAQVQARNHGVATNDLELCFKARINGVDEVWLAQHEGKWLHKWGGSPTDVTINGHPWDVARHPGLALNPPLLPELMDLQRATLTPVSAPGIITLGYERERLCLDFEDPKPGGPRSSGNWTEAVVRVPRFRERHLVRLKAGVPDALLGAPLNIYRFPASGEAYALLPGQRRFDMRGQRLVALESGQYQFEVLHQAGSNLLAALKTDLLNISGPTNVDLRAQRIEPGLYGPNGRPTALSELLLRSTRPCGAISWKAPDGSNPAPLSLLLSEGQSYKLHAFGHAGSDYVAVWTTTATAEFPRITVGPDQWRTCAFRWTEGSPPAKARGVVLEFADGRLEVPERARFCSNRRFFTVAYWLAFEGGRKALFQPRGYVFPKQGAGEVALGGPLHPLASAAVLPDESLTPKTAKRLWCELTLADPQNYLLDTEGSTIGWKPALTTRDGRPARTAPLLKNDVQRLGNLEDTLVAGAFYVMNGATQHVSLHPAAFVSHRTVHFVTRVPPYHEWNTRAYLAKAERELDMIARARQRPLASDLRLELDWRLASGLATSGGKSVTMPLTRYLACQDWFSPSWALGHEMLHTFGLGHSREMDRLSQNVDDQMAEFQAYVADHPEYVPEGWAEPTAPEQRSQ